MLVGFVLASRRTELHTSEQNTFLIASSLFFKSGTAQRSTRRADAMAAARLTLASLCDAARSHDVQISCHSASPLSAVAFSANALNAPSTTFGSGSRVANSTACNVADDGADISSAARQAATRTSVSASPIARI